MLESRHSIYIGFDGKARRLGIDEPPSEVVAWNWAKRVLVLKIPGHSYWAGRGVPRGRVGQSYSVLRMENDGWWYPIIEFETAKR